MLLDTTSPSKPTNTSLLGKACSTLRMRVVGGALDGQLIRLTAAKVSIGGGVGCTLRLRSPGCHPLCVWILRGPYGAIVQRFAPQVLLNGGAFEESELHNGDVLRIGSMEFQVISGADVESTREVESGEAQLQSELPTAAREAIVMNEMGDPWRQPFAAAFGLASNNQKRTRQSLRRRQNRRVRHLIDVLRQQTDELQHLQNSLNQQHTSAAQADQQKYHQAVAERDEATAETRRLTELLAQLQAEVQAASVAHADELQQLRAAGRATSDRLAQLADALDRKQAEADEIRTSTAAQIEQLSHAFDLVRQERDALLARQQQDALQMAAERERLGGDHNDAESLREQFGAVSAEAARAAASAAAEVESLQGAVSQLKEDYSASCRREAELQNQIAATANELVDLRQASQRQESLAKQVLQLKAELELRDAELQRTRAASTAKTNELLTSVDHVQAELSELQRQRELDREHATTGAAELRQQLAAAAEQLRLRDAELLQAQAASNAQTNALQTEIQQLSDDAAYVSQQLQEQRRLNEELQQEAVADAARFNRSLEQLRNEMHAERARSQSQAGAMAEHDQTYADERASLQAELQRSMQALEDFRLHRSLEANQVEERLALAGQAANQAAQTLAEERQNHESQRQQLTSQIAGLEEQLAAAQADAASAAAQVQPDTQSSAALQQQFEAAEQTLRDAQQSLAEQAQLIQRQTSELALAADQQRLSDEECGQLAQQRESLESAAQQECQAWRERCEMLEAAVSELKEHLQQLPAAAIDEVQPSNLYCERVVTQPMPRAGFDLNFLRNAVEAEAAVGQVETPSPTDQPEANAADDVSAALARLKQAGIWHESPTQTVVEEPMLPEATAGLLAPSFDATEQTEAPTDYSRFHIGEDLNDDMPIGQTMDAATLMAQRIQPGRSWRDQMLGDMGEVAVPAEEASVPSPVDSGVASVGDDAPSSTPLQAVGHGSWRAQLLGADETPAPADEQVAPSPYAFNQSAYEAPEEEFVEEVAPPAWKPTSAVAASGSGDGDEESIEAYMSRLLKRVGGDNPLSISPAQVAPRPVKAPTVPKPATLAPQAPVDPVSPSEFVPRSQAPEQTNLAAMRELANSAARAAIDTHAKRSTSKRFNKQLIFAGITFAVTTGLIVWAIYHGSLSAWLCVGIAMLVLAYWGMSSVGSGMNKMRLNRPSGVPAADDDVAEIAAVPKDAEASVAPEEAAN